MLTEYANWSAGHDRAKLLSRAPLQPGVVVFNYNPAKVSLRRTAKAKTFGTSQGSSSRQYGGTELATITVSEITLEGMDVRARCDLLMGWTAPPQGFLEGLSTPLGKFGVKQPSLIFQWGPPQLGLFYQVQLTDVSITYVRFSQLGVPIRAQVTLTMKEERNPFLTAPTNPHSGGIEGRRAHQVREGDSLARITTENYGHPRHWRALAKANGIADPLRLKPGTVVYLPSPSELYGEETR